MRLVTRYLAFSLLVVFGCNDEEENKLRNRVLGDYTGTIEYFDNPFPGHSSFEPVSFTVKKHGLNNILIEVDYDLSIPVTKSLTSSTDDTIITLGFNKQVTYSASGITIECGDVEINSWGKMCGFYNENNRTLDLFYTWGNNSSATSGARLHADQVE